MQEQKISPFQSFSPVQLFVGGIVSGVLVLCTIGFFILLGVVLDDGTVAVKANPTPTVAANPTPTTGSGNIALAAVTEEDYIRGNKDASVTIVEYSDLECPFCQNFHNTMKQVIDKYGDDVRWVYRHFPLTSIHPNATKFAVASECAGEQGKFWEMTDSIFANPGAGSADTTLVGYASTLGLNTSSFSSCLSSGKYDDKITAQSQDAQRAGGRGTPYSVVIGPNGETSALSGAQPLSAVEAAIGQYLK